MKEDTPNYTPTFPHSYAITQWLGFLQGTSHKNQYFCGINLARSGPKVEENYYGQLVVYSKSQYVLSYSICRLIRSLIREAWKLGCIVGGQNVQMCLSLRCKEIDTSTAKRLISNFQKTKHLYQFMNFNLMPLIQREFTRHSQIIIRN